MPESLLTFAAFLAATVPLVLAQPHYDAPRQVLSDQSMVALQAEPMLEDPAMLICHGPEDCNNHGVCDMDGRCRCAPGWNGMDCTIEFTCPNECSGNGLCRAHNCFCYHGWTGTDCSVAMFCPNNCNGNGRCDRGTCLCDAGFDGDDCSIEVGCPYKCVHGKCQDQVCVCDEGYYGVDCSDVDYCLTDCSGHGVCKDKRCICDFGYTGVVCSTVIPCPRKCSQRGECVNGTCLCDLGFTGVDCSEDCCPDQNVQCSAGKACVYPPCHCHNDCNDNGICHRGRCICRESFFGDDCSMKYCPANCSNHGTCDTAIGECTCDEGWKGVKCDTVECPEDCNNHGECMLFSGTTRICLCELGYTGQACGEEVPCPGHCSGHGICKLGICYCENGFDGPDCAEEVEPWIPCENDCNGHGRCENDVCIECEEGYKGKLCETKFSIVRKLDGTIACPGEPECSSHGLCGPTGRCFCTEGWLGEDCSMQKCPEDCNGRGECTGGVCMCTPPYHSGPLESCELMKCPNNCSGPSHGQCNKNTGTCSCLPPWEKEDCSSQPCPGDPECSDQGTCDNQLGQCDCLTDYAGEDCSIYMRCPNDCSGNGVCFRGNCYCYNNFTGPSCKTLVRPPPPPGMADAPPAGLKEAQQLYATSRSAGPPLEPEPAEFSIEQKKDLFRTTFGQDWLKYWTMVHSTDQARKAFTEAVSGVAPLPGSPGAQASLEEQQKELFKSAFGEDEWEDVWDKIMANANLKTQYHTMFEIPPGTYGGGDGSARGGGLPPAPLPARDNEAEQQAQRRQKLFTETFGDGDGLAMEMLIFGNRTKRDLFTGAFSQFLKENNAREVADKRESWENDMMQLMTDALGEEGPEILADIYADPTRATAFRKAFAGYLGDAPSAVSNR